MVVYNPYQNIDWDNIKHYQSLTHAHLMKGIYEDEEERQAVFENAYNKGIRHFAQTEYDYLAYPLEDYYNLSNLEETVYNNPNTERTGIQGLPSNWVHINTLGSLLHNEDPENTTDQTDENWGGLWRNLVLETLKEAHYQGEKYQPLLQINHPTRRSEDNYADIDAMVNFTKNFIDYKMNNCKLFEIYNASTYSGDRTGGLEKNLIVWDRVLKTGRLIFSVGNPDHTARRTDEDWTGRNFVLLPDNTEDKEFLKAYRKGQSYVALYNDGLKFTDISISNNIINVEIQNGNKIKFLDDTGVLKEENTTKSTYEIKNERYIRIEAENNNSNRLFSQPIMLIENPIIRRRKRAKIILL